MEETDKQTLVALKYGAIFESIQEETQKNKAQISHDHNLRGTYHSGSHLIDIMNLELDNIRKLLKSMFSILKEVYYFRAGAYTLEDKTFLSNKIEELFNARIGVSRDSLSDYIKRLRANHNFITIFNNKAYAILNDVKRDIEIEILSNKITSVVLPDITTNELIKTGECTTIEFKSSFQWDVEKGCQNKALRKEAINTIAAFSNTKGGYLLIGVDNKGGILGLENDYSLISKRNKDGFLQLFSQELENRTNKEFALNQDFIFEEHNGREICKIKINFGNNPIFVNYDKNEEFYIRRHESTIKMDSVREIAQYVRDHWPRKA